MRIVYIVILVLLGILLVLPYTFGINAEKEYEKLIQLATGNQGISVLETTYERGWLSSKAKTVFSVNGDDGELARIADNSVIYHGPVPLGLLGKGSIPLKPILGVIDSKAVLAPAPGSEYENIMKGFPPIIHKTVFNLNGGGTSEVIVPGIESVLENEDEIFSWSGLTATVDFKPDFSEINTELSSAGMTIRSRDLDFTLKGLSGDSDITYEGGDFSLPLGTLTGKIESIDILNKDGESGGFQMSLKNLEFQGINEESAGTLNIKHNLRFKELSLGELKYGNGGYDFALRNIDKKAWKEIQKILQKSGQKQGEDKDVLQNEELAEIMALLPQIVSKSPELEISDLVLETGEGELKGSLFISINGAGLEDPEMALNPMFLMAALNANAELSVTQTLLEDALLGFNVEEIQNEISNGDLEELSEQEIQNLAKERTKKDIENFNSEKVLILEDGRYVLKAEYSTGQVIINGNPIGLDKLLGQ